MPTTRFVNKCCIMLRNTKCSTYFNWAKETEYILNSNGFGHVWLNKESKMRYYFSNIFPED